MIRSYTPIRRAIAATGLAAIVVAVSTLAGPAAGAQPANPFPGGTFNVMPISPLTVKAGGHEATLTFITAEPTTVTVDYKPVTPTTGTVRPIRPLQGVLATPATTPVTTPGFTIQGQIHFTYTTAHELKLTGLASNSNYIATVTATTQSNQKLTAQQSFTTLKQRVRLTLESITISDDGDVIGNGEPTWFYQLSWPTGSMKDCFPQSGGRCREGDYDEGVVIPSLPNGQRYTYVLAEENFQPMNGTGAGEEDFTTMPTTLFLSASAKESDSFLQSALDAFFDGYATIGGDDLRWDVPQGVEYANQRVRLGARDDNFASTMQFIFEVFYDNQTYTPNDGRIHASDK